MHFQFFLNFKTDDLLNICLKKNCFPKSLFFVNFTTNIKRVLKEVSQTIHSLFGCMFSVMSHYFTFIMKVL